MSDARIISERTISVEEAELRRALEAKTWESYRYRIRVPERVLADGPPFDAGVVQAWLNDRATSLPAPAGTGGTPTLYVSGSLHHYVTEFRTDDPLMAAVLTGLARGGWTEARRTIRMVEDRLGP